MSTPTPSTLLPQTVRIAKLIGTIGSAYTAGAYLTSSGAVLPALARFQTRDLSLILADLKNRLATPLIVTSSIASSAFAYVAYILYSTPTLLIPLTSIATSQASFFPHTESTDLIIGGGWEFYAGAAALLAAVIPWQILGVGKVEKRIEAANVAGPTTADLSKWRKGQFISGGLAAVGLGLAGYGQAWW